MARAKIGNLSLEKISTALPKCACGEKKEYLVFENRAAGEKFDVIQSNFRGNDVKFPYFGAGGENFDFFLKIFQLKSGNFLSSGFKIIFDGKISEELIFCYNFGELILDAMVDFLELELNKQKIDG